MVAIQLRQQKLRLTFVHMGGGKKIRVKLSACSVCVLKFSMQLEVDYCSTWRAAHLEYGNVKKREGNSHRSAKKELEFIIQTSS